MAASVLRSLSELPDYLQVLRNLVVRDLKVKYQRSLLGFVWTLLYPTAMLAIYITIFGFILRFQIEGYWAYLVAGLLPFQFIMSAVVEGAGAVRSNANLVRKIYFPSEILVVATVTAKLVEFCLQLLVAVALLAVLHRGGQAHFSPAAALIVLPGAILLVYLFALGLALPLAAWSVVYRDLEHIVALVMTAWFYMTPIFWSLDMARQHLPGAGEWFVLNPAAGLLDLFRGPLHAGTWPVNQALQTGGAVPWAVAALAAAASCVAGYALFNRSRAMLAEVV